MCFGYPVIHCIVCIQTIIMLAFLKPIFFVDVFTPLSRRIRFHLFIFRLEFLFCIILAAVIYKQSKLKCREKNAFISYYLMGKHKIYFITSFSMRKKQTERTCYVWIWAQNIIRYDEALFFVTILFTLCR